MFDLELNAEYKAAEKHFWEGRKSNPDMGNQYWHQEIELLDLKQELKADSNLPSYAILGYVCDEGVRRNRGRMGAAEGPSVIRDRLAKLPIHFEDKRVLDVGDVSCVDDDMESCQMLFSSAISKLIQEGVFPIAIGGGHDMAYAHYKGIIEALKSQTKEDVKITESKIGIINFDAHFDLRPVEGKANSGTPFSQILKEAKVEEKTVDYFAIGIQQQSNTKELYQIAKAEGVAYAENYDCESSSAELESLKQRLQPMIDRNDYLYVTIDLDGFSSAYAPGVSAPSPLGFTPYFVFKLLAYLLASNKVISMDIAELNPSFDRDKLTANLAAKMIDFVVMKHA